MLALMLLLLTLGTVPAVAMAAPLQNEFACCMAHGAAGAHGVAGAKCSLRMHRLMMQQQQNQPGVSGPGCRCEHSTAVVSSVVAIAVPALALSAPMAVAAETLHQPENSYRAIEIGLGQSRAPPLA
jgi:hypothetical protein